MKIKSITLLSMCLFTTLSSCSSYNEIDKNNNVFNQNVEEGEYHELNDFVSVNYLPGQYNNSLDLEFKYDEDLYSIYYSVDGSYPEKNDGNLYRDSIEVERIVTNDIDDYPLTTSVDGILENDTEGKCVSNIYNDNIQRPGNYPMFQKQNVITIRVIDKETNEDVFNRSLTYIIDDEEYTIPVVSLTMPYEDWFDENTGMYNRIREDIEKRVYLEYFDFANEEFFSLNSKIKLGGNWTLGYPMRTLNLNFNKDEHGNKNTPVTIPIFKDRSKRGNRDERLTKLTRFRLHSGGNAFESWTGFNDAIIQNMMESGRASTTGFRPCIAYLNGEYWGMYYIREHYSDTYFKDNYGVDKDDVLFYELKGGFLIDDGDEEAGAIAIKELEDYINYQDFSQYEVYKNFITNMIDEDSFIDMFIAELYASNWDFVGNLNNLKMWRTSKVDESNPYADGRWRFCLHDVDFAFTEDTNFLDKNVANSYANFKMFNNMLKQPEFRTKLYNRATYLIKNNLSAREGCRVLNEMVEEVMPYKTNAMIRWGKSANDYNVWLNDVNNTYRYIENKSRSFLATIDSSLKQY